MSKCFTAEEALAFVRESGVVLVSAKGTAPRLTQAIIGEPIKVRVPSEVMEQAKIMGEKEALVALSTRRLPA